MTRNFYFYGNLFLGLGVAAGLLQGILRIAVGPQIFFLDNFLIWFFILSALVVVGSIFMLKYYRYQSYWFTFSSGIAVTLMNLVLVAILYMALLSRQAQVYYIPALFVALFFGLVYGLSLIFSRAGKSAWLKAAGICILIMGVIFGSAFAWSMVEPRLQIDGTLEKISAWTSLAQGFIPLLFIMQFSHELKLHKPQDEQNSAPGFSENLAALAGIVALLCTIAFGVMIAREGLMTLYWKNRNAERAQALVDRSESRTFVNGGGDTLRYILMKPVDYDHQMKYPLVVCLPYGGYEAPPAQLLSNDINRKKYPSFLFVPYSPAGSSWGGVPGRPAMDSLVYGAINALEDPGIDVKRRYVSGVSLGGYGSWQFICKHPEMFAAAIPVCGEGDPELAARIIDVRVWAFHGAKDRNVPVSGSRNMIAAIRKAGGDPRYTEFPDKGHNIWYDVSQTPGVLEWLFAQKRE